MAVRLGDAGHDGVEGTETLVLVAAGKVAVVFAVFWAEMAKVEGGDGEDAAH